MCAFTTTFEIGASIFFDCWPGDRHSSQKKKILGTRAVLNRRSYLQRICVCFFFLRSIVVIHLSKCVWKLQCTLRTFHTYMFCILFFYCGLFDLCAHVMPFLLGWLLHFMRSMCVHFASSSLQRCVLCCTNWTNKKKPEEILMLMCVAFRKKNWPATRTGPDNRETITMRTTVHCKYEYESESLYAPINNKKKFKQFFFLSAAMHFYSNLSKFIVVWHRSVKSCCCHLFTESSFIILVLYYSICFSLVLLRFVHRFVFFLGAHKYKIFNKNVKQALGNCIDETNSREIFLTTYA